MSLVTRHISAKMEIARLERLNADLLRQQQEDRRAIRDLAEERRKTRIAVKALLAARSRLYEQPRQADADAAYFATVDALHELTLSWRKDDAHAAALQRAREEKGT